MKKDIETPKEDPPSKVHENRLMCMSYVNSYSLRISRLGRVLWSVYCWRMAQPGYPGDHTRAVFVLRYI